MMKKIMAGAVAAILAVSTLATAAFAAVVVENNGAKQYNATYTFTETGVLTNAGDGLSATLAGNGIAGDAIAKVSYKLTVIDADSKSQTATKETTTPSTAVVFTVTEGAAGFKDFNNIADGAAAQLETTVTVKNTSTAYNKDTAAVGFTVTGSNFASLSTQTPKPTVLEDTTNGTVADLTITSAKLTVAQKAELKDATTATLDVTFNKAASTDGTITIAKNGTATETKLVKKGDTTATFTVPVADIYNAEYDAFETAVAYTFTLANTGDAASIAAAKFTAGEVADPDASVDEPADPDATDADDTDAADTDAADDKTDGKGDNTETGVVLAVVPAIIAGAAIVVSRKRK